MRLLVVSQYFWPENFRINDLVSELLKRGHKVTILTGYPNYPNGQIFQKFRDTPHLFSNYEGAEVVRVPLISRGEGKVNLFLNYLSFAIMSSTLGILKLRGRKFDAIFTFQVSPITVAIPALIAKIVKKAPMALWVLDLWPASLAAVGAVRSKFILRLVEVMVASIYNHCDLILVQSKSFIPEVAKHIRKPIDILYFPSWSDVKFNNRNIKPATEIYEDSSFFNIMFTGNIGIAQDFPAILDAASKLKEKLKVRWYIIGDGSMAGWLAQEIYIRGLEDTVFLLGEFHVKRIPSFIKHADALLISLKDEPIFALTIPGKLQSYMASGKPILAMINGEVAQIVKDSGCGVVCAAGDSNSLADAIYKIFRMNSKERNDMGQKAIHYSNLEFNRSILISKLELWINRIIKQ